MNNMKNFMINLARMSGEILHAYYGNSGFRIYQKNDNSPVTDADLHIEQRLRECIKQKYPDHGIIGEEYGEERPGSDFVWVIDPIDGTISFTAGVPLFGTLIGLLYKGFPVLGLIFQPVLDIMVLGDGFQTTINGQSVKMRKIHRLEEARLLITDVKNINNYKAKKGFEKLQEKCSLMRTWGDCYGYILLARGFGDIMLDPVMKPWDLWPLIPIVQGAGGKITSWTGGAVMDSACCVAAHPSIHQQVIDTLNLV
ncbi:MAG: inositol monophosphatase family protein [Calditrichaeota bacterium]|nr:MAG: inositol monophosphatase family protein [Calditrichota bacterium]